MTARNRRVRDWILLSYHLFTVSFLFCLNQLGVDKGGPCNPGVETLFFMLFILILIVLLIVSVFLLIRSRANKYFFIINFSVLLILIISIVLSSIFNI